MGATNIEQLLVPVLEGEPSGANLEYDPQFAELDRTAQGKPERRMGEVHVPAEPPDWDAVLKQSLALLERTRDLRLAVYVSQALLHREGYAGLAEGTALVAGILRVFWPTVHPQLDHEDDDDPTMRINALSALCAPPMLLALRRSPLAQARGLGAVSLSDIQALTSGEAPPKDAPVVDSATVEGVFQGADFDALEALEGAVQQCVDSISAIDGVFETHTGSRGPDFAPLTQVLREVRHVLKPRMEARRAALAADSAVSEDGSAAEEAGGSASAPRAALSGEIHSRDDVVRALDKICAYYARAEPASPLPLLLERCKRLVSCSFLEIIQDIVPDSVAQVNKLAGIKPE